LQDCYSTRSNLNWRSLWLVSALLLSACGGGPSDQTLEFFALGTEVSVSLYAVSARQAEQASEQLQTYFARVGHDWYPWNPGELRAINVAIEQQQAVAVSPRLATVIRRAAQIERLSNNRFNAGLGHLTERWGLHMLGDEPPTKPAVNEIARLLAQALGVTSIRWIDDQIVGAPAGLMLDLGGIAKGAILEDSVQILHNLDIENAIVNIGGDLTVIGAVNGRPASIGIRSPAAEMPFATVDIAAGETIVTSGDYERYVDINGKRYAHILNPRSGYPVEHSSAVTVIHSDAMLADAAATALMVGGPAEFDQLASALQVEFALLIDASGDLHLTPAMDLRLKWLD
jgi:thiamine biosynthesis lipoprotein